MSFCATGTCGPTVVEPDSPGSRSVARTGLASAIRCRRYRPAGIVTDSGISPPS
jgi:hypothetical protein